MALYSSSRDKCKKRLNKKKKDKFKFQKQRFCTVCKKQSHFLPDCYCLHPDKEPYGWENLSTNNNKQNSQYQEVNASKKNSLDNILLYHTTRILNKNIFEDEFMDQT